MTRLPRVTGKRLIRALGRAGFEVLLMKILRDCEMTADMLRSLL